MLMAVRLQNGGLKDLNGERFKKKLKVKLEKSIPTE
jgi:hypothetical protein